MAIPSQITISGNIYIKYIDDIVRPKIGDILLLLNDDATSPYAGDYENSKVSGTVKAKIYDGVVWQFINLYEFCSHKENKFTKRQRAIDAVLSCREIILGYKDQIMYKIYRGHFTLDKYEPNIYYRKVNDKRRQV